MAAGSGTAQYGAGAVSREVSTGVVGGLLNIARAFTDLEFRGNVQAAFTKSFTILDLLQVIVAREIIALMWFVAHLSTATSELAGYFEEVAQDIERIERNEHDAWSLFLTAKYPADLRALYRDLSNLIDQRLKGNAAENAANLKPLWKAVRELQQWRKDKVTPDLNQWTTFYGQWKKTYLQPVTTLTNWLSTPADFGHWALPIVVSQLPSSLRSDASKTSATSIAAILTSTWSNDANVIYSAVLKWLVTDN